jgi:SAM-dependent methyltransferase
MQGTVHLQQLGEQKATQQKIPCPVCQETSFSLLLTPSGVEAEYYYLQEFYRQRKCSLNEGKGAVAYTQTDPAFIVRCQACGTVFRNPQPTAERLQELYASDSYGKTALDQMAANQDQFFRLKAEGLKAYLPASATVLEIGSFVGSFLRAAGVLGWKAVGVDIGAETVAYTRAAGLEVIEGDIHAAELPTAAWDGLFIWNTFDQLYAPGRVLERAFALLKTEGILVLRFPNGEFENGCLQLRQHRQNMRRAERLMHAQAYNSFLTFPYLVGYTVNSVHKLLHCHHFTIEAVEGDTLVRLADQVTLPFAVQEEARYKRAVKRLCRRLEGVTGQFYYPWLDVIARKQEFG